MLCAVYKSPKKESTFLYIKQRDNFSDVPDALLDMFGSPVLVTIVNLSSRDKLAIADIETVKAELNDKGFYLQLPPPKEDLLAEHKAQLKNKQLLDKDA